MNEKLYQFLLKFSAGFQSFLASLTKAYLNTLVGQGFLKKIIGFVVDNLFEEVVDPLVKVALVRIGYHYDVKEGKRLVTKMNEARENNNEADYNSSVDDILG